MKRKRDSRGTSHAAVRRSAGAKRRRLRGFTAPRALSPGAIARLAAEVVALPSSYGETSLAVFPVQPYAVHACWEVTPDTLERGRRDLGAEADAVEAVLRFHGVPAERGEDSPGSSTFDVSVDVGAGDWYVDLWSPGRTFVVELGLRTPSGRFHPLARSNRVATPRAEPVPVRGGPTEDARPVAAPISQAVGAPPQARRTAPGGRMHRREDRAASRPIGGAGPAESDLTGQTEAAFRAGISSRR